MKSKMMNRGQWVLIHGTSLGWLGHYVAMLATTRAGSQGCLGTRVGYFFDFYVSINVSVAVPSTVTTYFLYQPKGCVSLDSCQYIRYSIRCLRVVRVDAMLIG